MPGRSPLAHAVGAVQTNFPVKFHGINPQALPADARRAKWPEFSPPAAGPSRRYPGPLLQRRRQASSLRRAIAAASSASSAASRTPQNASDPSRGLGMGLMQTTGFVESLLRLVGLD